MFALTINNPIPHDWRSAVARTMAQAEVQQTITVSPDMAVLPYRYVSGNALTTAEQQQNSIEALGWSKADALETLLRLRTFAEDWDYPGMEVYDDL